MTEERRHDENSDAADADRDDGKDGNEVLASCENNAGEDMVQNDEVRLDWCKGGIKGKCLT